MNKRNTTLVSIVLFFYSFGFSQINISGKVVRHNGMPLADVTVVCTSANPVQTDVDGNFSFTDLPAGQDYLIEGFFETDVYDGITVLDALLSRLFINELDTPSFFENWATDANQSQGVSGIDIVFIIRNAIRSSNNIPNPYWRFYDQNVNVTAPEQGIYLENVVSDTSMLELVAVKSGDNGLDPDYMPPPSDAPQTLFYMEEMMATQGEQVTIEVKVKDYKSISGFQHGLHWDATVLEFVEIEAEAYPMDLVQNENLVSQGDLLILGAENFALGLDIDDDSTLYHVKFNVLEDIDQIETVLDFSDAIMPFQTIYTVVENMEIDPYILEPNYEVGVEIPVNINEIDGLTSFEIAPNPSTGTSHITIEFERVQNADLGLYTVTGKLIEFWTFQTDRINQSIRLDALSSGTYIVKLRTKEGLLTRRLVKI